MTSNAIFSVLGLAFLGLPLLLLSKFAPVPRHAATAPALEMAVTDIPAPKLCCAPPVVSKACVFKTLMGEESMPSDAANQLSKPIQSAIDSGLTWISAAQLADGGWSANDLGHRMPTTQGNLRTVDPKRSFPETTQRNMANTGDNAAAADPASTAMVCMALLRCQHTPSKGLYAAQLQKGMDFLMQTTEIHKDHPGNNTTITGTQPQRKLGANIDVVLTAQFFSNVLNYLSANDPQTARVRRCLELCIQKIEANQAGNGALQGSGWAGVLQSSFANNAVESAQAQGIKVDTVKLARARDFQKSNYDLKTGSVNTDLGAGVMLYSVSGSGRASAQEARKAKEEVAKAKKKGLIHDKDGVSVENLQKAGLSESEALRYNTAYQINSAATKTAQNDRVMTGFGNNGGEEFLSYLQTGEGLIIAKDEAWKNWYDKISKTLLNIQNADGSWNGHHCITSPVFCTATCLLVLSVQNDIAHLQK